MIRLKLEADKKQILFFFFLRTEVVYVVSGIPPSVLVFTSSLFILNCILRYHAAEFPSDSCRRMLENQFYVDNLVMTSDCPDELCNLYDLSRKRLQKGVSSCSLATLCRDPGQNGGGWYPEQSWNWLGESARISVQPSL